MARMGRYGRRRHISPTGAAGGSFWLSFSDLMSGLLLVFVLIMFYSVYQYFDMLEVKTAQLLRQSDLISVREAELSQKDALLQTQQEELSASAEKLSASETELLAQQAQLLLRDQELADLADALSTQKAELAAAQSALSAQTTELTAAQSLLAQQKEELTAAQSLLSAQEALFSQQQSLLLSQQSQLDQLVGVRRRIVESLSKALSDAGISAVVDPASGAITLNASVLFDRSEFALTEAGKRTIDAFLPVYLQVLLAPGARENVSEIIIEGHTDSVGSYMGNLELSQSRALAVARYVLSDGYPHIDQPTKDYLRTIVTANGQSESKLIYTADGAEDADASRRVEFKFRLHDEQMIDQLSLLLTSFADDAVHPTAEEGTAP